MLLTSRRTLLQALIVSLLIHAVLLLRVFSPFPMQLDVPGTTINVVMRSDSRGDSEKSVNTPAAKSPANPVEPSTPANRNAVVRQSAVPQPSPVAGAAPPAQPEARDSGRVAPASSGVVAGAGAASSAVATPAAAREGVSADDLRQYRMSLATTVRRMSAEHYPALARKRGWEGTVEVVVNVNALLPVPEVALTRSSGRGILDEQALKVMTQAVRVTALPEGLKGRDYSVLFKWDFSLKDDQ